MVDTEAVAARLRVDPTSVMIGRHHMQGVRLLLMVLITSGCTIDRTVVMRDGPTCGEGTVLHGNECVATQSQPIISDATIRKMIIEASLRSYSGNCPCPYNRASNGSQCGGRSAYSRPGGASPLCYDSDISDAMVNDYRRRLGH